MRITHQGRGRLEHWKVLAEFSGARTWWLLKSHVTSVGDLFLALCSGHPGTGFISPETPEILAASLGTTHTISSSISETFIYYLPVKYLRYSWGANEQVLAQSRSFAHHLTVKGSTQHLLWPVLLKVICTLNSSNHPSYSQGRYCLFHVWQMRRLKRSVEWHALEGLNLDLDNLMPECGVCFLLWFWFKLLSLYLEEEAFSPVLQNFLKSGMIYPWVFNINFPETEKENNNIYNSVQAIPLIPGFILDSSCPLAPVPSSPWLHWLLLRLPLSPVWGSL